MRKGKPQLERIDIDELFSNSSNRGMLSFLQRPPQEAQARLLEKQRVDEADSQRLEASIATAELPAGKPADIASTVLPFPAPLRSERLKQPEHTSRSLPGNELLGGDLEMSQGMPKSPPGNDWRKTGDVLVGLPNSNLPPGSDLLANQTEIQAVDRGGKPLSSGDLLISKGSHAQIVPQPSSNLLPDSTLQPDSDLLVDQTEAASMSRGDLLISKGSDAQIVSPPSSNLLPDSMLPPASALLIDQTEAASNGSEGMPLPSSTLLPDSTLPPASDLPIDQIEAATINAGHKRLPRGDLLRSEIVSPPSSNLLPDSTLLPDSELRADQTKAASINTGSNLLRGGDLRTGNGRIVRLRPARSVQDAHTNGEHLLLTAMWKKGTPESDDSRLLRAGLSELARLTGSHKTSCRAYVRALIAKLAIEEAETFDAAAGTEGARVYRIFSFNTILERRRRANLTHVIRTGAVFFVNPTTGERLAPSSNPLPDSSLPTDSNVLPESNFHTDPGSNHPHTPGSNHPPLNKNRDQEVSKQTSSSAAIYQALTKYGHVDDDALSRLIGTCRQAAPDCTQEEIIHFIQEKAAILRAGRIHNPVGFLLTAVPKCFSGETFLLYRAEQIKRREYEAAVEASRRAEAAATRIEQEKQLADPEVPEAHKELIREWLKAQGQRPD